MKRRLQPVIASGPSSVGLILFTKSARTLASQILLLSKPTGGLPSPLRARNWAPRKRDRPSPWLPSVPRPNQPRLWDLMNCSTISNTSR